MGICFSIEENQKHFSFSDSISTNKPKSGIHTIFHHFNSIHDSSIRFYLLFNLIDESVGNDSGVARATNTPLGTGSMNIKELREGAGYSNVHIFTYQELRLATKQFRPDFILGEGGFGVVYKGVIDDTVRTGYKSTEVAIKELNREGFQGDREWLVCYLCFPY
jgi:hypothetical protein